MSVESDSQDSILPFYMWQEVYTFEVDKWNLDLWNEHQYVQNETLDGNKKVVGYSHDGKPSRIFKPLGHMPLDKETLTGTVYYEDGSYNTFYDEVNEKSPNRAHLISYQDKSHLGEVHYQTGTIALNLCDREIKEVIVSYASHYGSDWQSPDTTMDQLSCDDDFEMGDDIMGQMMSEYKTPRKVVYSAPEVLCEKIDISAWNDTKIEFLPVKHSPVLKGTISGGIFSDSTCITTFSDQINSNDLFLSIGSEEWTGSFDYSTGILTLNSQKDVTHLSFELFSYRYLTEESI